MLKLAQNAGEKPQRLFDDPMRENEKKSQLFFVAKTIVNGKHGNLWLIIHFIHFKEEIINILVGHDEEHATRQLKKTN